MKLATLVMAPLVCCICLGNTAAWSRAKSGKGSSLSALILQQTHVYLGKTRVMLTPTAVRLDGLGKFHFSFISKAPRWDVTIFRVDDLLACKQSLNQFCDQGLFSNYVFAAKSRLLPKGGVSSDKKLSGFTVRQTAWTNTIFACLPKNGYASQEAEALLYAAYKLPTAGQIPITFTALLTGKDWITSLDESGERRNFLLTEKISKEMVPTSQFEIPPGLSQTKSVTRIVVGSESKLKDTGADVLFNLGH